ncbi:MAG: peptidoglycan-associated lipoprotein Pal [Rhodoferax sp.]|nr:peptidoglycan-associated lipoprotein Pal [Rhodoferax sp.]
MKRLVWTLAAAALLGACSSPVKLDNVPVEDRSGAAGANTTTKTDNAATSAVKTVDIGKTDQDAAMRSANRVVYFDYDSFAIRPEFQSVIEAHGRFLKADKSKKVALEGHTDERGGREYNLALGQKRAEAVRRALALQGVAEAQMEAVSFGKEKPAVQGSTEAAMEKNRRTEISYR